MVKFEAPTPHDISSDTPDSAIKQLSTEKFAFGSLIMITSFLLHGWYSIHRG